MSYQKRPSWCGPASLQLALRVYGRSVSQRRIAELMETCDDGSDESDIARGADALGFAIHEFRTGHHGDARKWLLDLAPAVPLLLCVDRWEHWVCIAGQCGDRLWLFDPEDTPANAKRNGAWALLPKDILKRWRAARSDGGDRGSLYFGLAVLNTKRA